MTQLSLKSILVSSKDTEVEYPGFEGFKVTVSFLSRETQLNIRKKSTKISIKNRQPSEDFNEDLFLQLYVDSAIKGWSGLKLSYLESLAPVDLSGQDPEDFLEFSKENALYLMKNSPDFDTFITETVTDLANFTKNSSKK